MTVATATQPLRLEPDELAQRIAQAEPRAFLVEPRVLRRLIRYDRRLTGFGLRVPHRKAYVVSRAVLLEVVEPDELRPSREVPEFAILLSRPDADDLESLSAAELLRVCWRLLFHCRVHLLLEERLRTGTLTENAVLQRVHRIGQTEFDEIRSVLQAEGFLLPPRDTVGVYVEFAAVYLELKHFAPKLLPRYFPGLADAAHVEAVLAEDVDAAALMAQTRVVGAAEVELETVVPPASPRERRLPGRRVEARYRLLSNRAESAEKRGNLVRGALLRTQAARFGSPKQSDEALVGAHKDIDQLVGRLRDALDFPPEDTPRFRAGLRTLLEASPRAGWTVEARLLYDLQKVCVDDNREIFTVDLAGWLFSGFRRPIRRKLPMQREVLICKHLRSAARRLASVRIPETQRQSLEALLTATLRLAQEQMRHRLRPALHKALGDAGLKPALLVEEVARRKMVEELLDRVENRGYLQIGDLRDGIARNHLKLPDLASWRELVVGDKLLVTDRLLADRLDGVYRRGEFYLRWFQRLSSLGFGNPFGRLVTKYAVLPFGGAYMTLAFLEHMVDVELANRYSVAILGVFLLLLLNVTAFRRAVGHGLAWCWRVIQAVFNAIAGVFRLPLVRRIIESRAMLYAWRYVVKPLVIACAVATLARWAVPKLLHTESWRYWSQYSPELARLAAGTAKYPLVYYWLWLGLVYCVAFAVLNSRWGRDLEERIGDAISEAWWRLRAQLIANAYYFLVDLFRALLEHIDRLLYTVDEWLRFRAGETPISFSFKLVMGFAWFFVTYIVRFTINLLVEPQVNPLKHFPVVTVSHKLILPLAVTTHWAATPSPLAGLLLMLQLPISVELANWLALSVVWGIPGIFGFLAWELKNNWRLFAANRPRVLRPCVIGSHGETMLRLMRPGFHSGTLPKLYRKLRRAERKALKTGATQAVHKLEHLLHYVQEDVKRYVQRELIALLSRYQPWTRNLAVGEIITPSNTVRVEVLCHDFQSPPLCLSFEEHSGWLLARIAQSGWLDRLSGAERAIFRNALVGLYKTSGVHLLCEQLEALLHAAPIVREAATRQDQPVFDISPDGLVIWPQPGSPTEAVYDLQSEQMVPCISEMGGAGGVRKPTGASDAGGAADLPVLPRAMVVFSQRELPWDAWVAAWQDEATPAPLLPEFAVLPESRPDA